MSLFETLGISSRTVAPELIDSSETSARSEIPPDPDFSEDAEKSVSPERQCEVCGRDVEYSGRGRVPRKCPEHRGRTNVSSDGPSAPRQPRMGSLDKRKAKIVDNLIEINAILAGSVVMAAPVTGHTMLHTAPPAVVSFVEIAAKYPRMLDGLEKLTEVMPWVEVGKFAGGVAYAMAVDSGRLQPYGLVAEYLGVAEAAKNAHYVPPEETYEEEMAQPTIPGIQVASPKRFVMPDGA